MPGPAGQGDIVTFTSNSAPARLGAVQLFTTPAGAKQLVSRLKAPNGRIPAHYQVILKVKFNAGVPTETAFIKHRELGPTALADAK
jgi:hypothetical protein